MCLTEKEHAQERAEATAAAAVHRGMRVGGITVETGPLLPA